VNARGEFEASSSVFECTQVWQEVVEEVLEECVVVAVVVDVDVNRVAVNRVDVGVGVVNERQHTREDGEVDGEGEEGDIVARHHDGQLV